MVSQRIPDGSRYNPPLPRTGEPLPGDSNILRFIRRHNDSNDLDVAARARLLELMDRHSGLTIVPIYRRARTKLVTREKFEELADQWHRETDHLSSPDDIALHSAYLRIIGMGSAALPFIFDDLRRRGGQWYVALRALTGASPVTPDMSRSARAVKEAWLRWGREHTFTN